MFAGEYDGVNFGFMNVLILTDLSEVAKNAGEYAMHFLGDVSAHFYLLNIGKFSKEETQENELQKREEMALEKLNRRSHELQEISSSKGHSFTTIYWENDIITATRKFVQEKNIDLIVMGAAKKGYSPNTVVGNLTYEVLRKVRCNILIVPESTRYKLPEDMLFPIDKSAAMEKAILNFFKLKNIFDDAGVTVLEIENSDGNSKAGCGKKIRSGLKNRKVEVKKVKDTEMFDPGLLMTVQKNYDMVIMLGKSLSICHRLLHNKEGIYSNVANNLPILVLHK